MSPGVCATTRSRSAETKSRDATCRTSQSLFRARQPNSNISRVLPMPPLPMAKMPGIWSCSRRSRSASSPSTPAGAGFPFKCFSKA